jgi:putative nucleotidyltransferase with HDIG domain
MRRITKNFIFRSLTGTIPAEHKEEFFNGITVTNYNRSRNLSLLLVLVLIFLILLDYDNYIKGLWLSVPGYRYLFYGHLIFIIGVTLNLLYAFLAKLNAENGDIRHKRYFVLTFNIVTSLSCALVSTADQFIHGGITVYLLCIFGLAIVNFVRPKIMISIYTFSYLIFMLGITYAQTNSDIVRGHYINGTVLVILAVFLSSILYYSKVKDFLSRKTIEQQKIELENKNEELNKTNKELQESFLALDESQNMIFTLTLALESKDSNTHGHSQRVSEYVLAIANKLKLNETDKINLWRAAILHDIGKIGIPDNILKKRSSLSKTEWGIMRSHPSRGEAICSRLKFAREILPIIRHHHEHYDGNGYPDGLKGEEIPFLARIIGIADTVDAITSPRSYRLAGTMEQAANEIRRCSGTQFDPGLVEVFLEIYDSLNNPEENGDPL